MSLLLEDNRSKPCDTDVSGRHLCLDAVPQTGMLVTSLDLDLTVDCNMRCVYCFKEKRQETMPKRVAFDAIVWLLYASGAARELFVNFMGGEPLLQFDLIKELVPFGKRRASQHGKSIQFGMTTLAQKSPDNQSRT